MTSKQRILAAINGQPADRVPLTTWCFGFPAPPGLHWQTDGRDVDYWYTQRLEHLHSLPQPWTMADEFRRAEAWLALGIDDILEISVPWSVAPDVSWTDSVLPPGAIGGDLQWPVMVRTYQTAAGTLSHAVKRLPEVGPGWVVQPDCVPLFEDYNIPRAVRHAVTSAADVPVIAELYRPPDEAQCRQFAERMALMRKFAEEKGLFLQAWTAFGMDAAVWLTGTEGAVLMAMDDPDAFDRLLQVIFETDAARTELAAAMAGVDMVCQRGWYSSVDFWSPRLFDRLVCPYVAQLAEIAHRHGKKFAYTVTTGVKHVGPRLADAGVDVLYFVDPVQDKFSLEEARDLLGKRITLVGGINSVSLSSGDCHAVRRDVGRALEVLGPTNRFILHPVDAIFPDTSLAAVEAMIAQWRDYTGQKA